MLNTSSIAAVGTQKIIAIGFAVVLVLMMILTGLGLSRLGTLKKQMNALVTESNVKTESVFRMLSLSRERFASLSQMVLMRDPFDRDEEYMRYRAQATEFIRARDQMLALDMSPEELAVWGRARKLIQRDVLLHAQTLELAMEEKSETARGILLHQVRPLEYALLAAFNELIAQHRQANLQSLNNAEADYRHARAYMVGLTGLMMILGLVIAGVVIVRSRQAESALSQQTEVAINAAEQLSWAASHDSLTGLANRREMERHLGEMIEDIQSHGAHHVLFFIDLDRFKSINDSCGHFAGDELLRQLSDILVRHVRRGDLVARSGGDEFCIGLQNCQVDRASRIAESIRDDIAQFQFLYEGMVYKIGASIGLVKIEANMDVNKALSLADAACYKAKWNGRNQVCVFDASDQ